MPVAVTGGGRLRVETALYSFRSDRVHSGAEMGQNSEVGSPPTGAEAAGYTVRGSWAGAPEVAEIVGRI